MPIVIDRHTGEIISKPETTQEQKDRACEIVIRNYVCRHPEIFKEDYPDNDLEESEI